MLGMKRVSKDHRCPVCRKSHWCGVSDDGTLVICMRVPEGSVGTAKNGGYIHILRNNTGRQDCPCVRTVHLASKVKTPDHSMLALRFQAAAKKAGAYKLLSEMLALSEKSLQRFGVGYDPDTRISLWPLSDAAGRIIGLNRRWPDGAKKIMLGHHQGLYMPADLPRNLNPTTLLITEGGSDAVAAVDLGYWSVGRFCCGQNADLLIELIQRRQPSEVVLIPDADPPGQAGISRIVPDLLVICKSLKILTLPQRHKDLRNWCKAGATHEDMEGLIRMTPGIKIQF
jgi:hypothetical protein